MTERNPLLCLFDVDGTLTKPRQVIDASMLHFLLNTVKNECALGIVGGSDIGKIAEQMGGMDVLGEFDYVFSENGLVAWKNGEQIGEESIQNFMGEEALQAFINFSLRYMSELQLPVKRGTFIEFRKGLINVCPVGRSCSQAEREQFSAYDEQHKLREKFIEAIKERFPDLGLTYSIGGQISFDVFPNGWDKTYCLKYLNGFKDIHFFGDKTDKGGNDHEIFVHSRTIGHRVNGPEDTKRQLMEMYNINQV